MMKKHYGASHYTVPSRLRLHPVLFLINLFLWNMWPAAMLMCIGERWGIYVSRVNLLAPDNTGKMVNNKFLTYFLVIGTPIYWNTAEAIR